MARTTGERTSGDPQTGMVEQELSSLRFAAVARRLSETARSLGADVPAFRSPPRTPGAMRSIKRDRAGAATVAVMLRGRPGIAVIADMIDGVIAAGALDAEHAATVRDELWSAAARLLDAEIAEAAAVRAVSGAQSAGGDRADEPRPSSRRPAPSGASSSASGAERRSPHRPPATRPTEEPGGGAVPKAA